MLQLLLQILLYRVIC